MKWNNHIVVFDLETTACDQQAITEIGAVVLDPELDRVVGRFQSFVLPDYPVTKRAWEITGHNPEDLARAPAWPDVAKMFEDWVVATCGNIKRVRLAAWGNYFDINVLRNQYARHGLPYPFSGTCIDVKTAALMWAACSGRRTDKLSVEQCAEHMGLTPSGSYHRADVDADMTAQIFQRAMYELAGGVWIGKQYVHVGTFDV
jgi:DNA polymerase III epsilon subunit-like protein